MGTPSSRLCRRSSGTSKVMRIATILIGAASGAAPGLFIPSNAGRALRSEGKVPFGSVEGDVEDAVDGDGLLASFDVHGVTRLDADVVADRGVRGVGDQDLAAER